MNTFAFSCWQCGLQFEADCTAYRLTDSAEWDQGGPIAACTCPRCGVTAYAYPAGKP